MPAASIAIIKDYLNEIGELTAVQRLLIERRYLPLLEQCEKRAVTYTWLYNTIRFTLTIGGVILPAFLSIQFAYAESGAEGLRDFDYGIFWTTWCISVIIGVCTSIIAAFKIDRRYFALNSAIEVMESEMHQFFGLTGRYATTGHNNRPATHIEKVQFLFYALERLHLSQIHQEYIQLSGSGTMVGAVSGEVTGASGIIIRRRSGAGSTGSGTDGALIKGALTNLVAPPASPLTAPGAGADGIVTEAGLAGPDIPVLQRHTMRPRHTASIEMVPGASVASEQKQGGVGAATAPQIISMGDLQTVSIGSGDEGVHTARGVGSEAAYAIREPGNERVYTVRETDNEYGQEV